MIHWYNYVAAFFASVFLINTIPHLVHGLSGNRFPTPFAKPYGKGLSSPLTNTLWAFFNLIVAYLLIKAGRVTLDTNLLLLVFFAGMVAISIRLSINFSKKVKE